MANEDFNEEGRLISDKPQRSEEIVRQQRSMVEIKGALISPQDLAQQLEYARVMSHARLMIADFLQGNVGDCNGVIEKARNLGMSPYDLAAQMFEVDGKGGKKSVGYMAQVVNAIVDKFAPLQKRLRYTYHGEGDHRTCTVSGLFIGETEPHEYTSPPVGKIHPKNSPLWTSDPDQQLGYLSMKRWVRRYCPLVLLNVYDKEDLMEGNIGPDYARDVTPTSGPTSVRSLRDQLARANRTEGFGSGAAGGTVAAHRAIEKEATPVKAEPPAVPAVQEVAATEATQDEARADAEIEVEPPAKKAPASSSEYLAYLHEWCAATESKDDIKTRFKNERSMRTKLHVGVTDAQEIMEGRLAEMGG
jgi:hypothetical protein